MKNTMTLDAAVKHIRSYWDAEARKDMDAVLAHFAPDAMFTAPGAEHVGHQQIARFYQGMFDGFQSIDVTIRDAVGNGSTVAVEWTCRLVPTDDSPREAQGCNVFRFRDGRIAQLRCYFNPEDFQ